MDDDAPPLYRATEYRNAAAEFRLLAQQMLFLENRTRLLALAASYDKLADRVEEHLPHELLAANAKG
jgi:hypothetical protein